MKFLNAVFCAVALSLSAGSTLADNTPAATNLAASADLGYRWGVWWKPRWQASWGTAVAVPSPFDAPPPVIADATLRQIVRVSRGGRRVRVWLTNEFGTRPLSVGAAYVGLHEGGGAVAKNTPLTFGGASSVSIAAGTKVLSDPVRMNVPDLAELAISTYLPEDVAADGSPVSYHVRALQTSYLAAGDQAAADAVAGATPIVSWFFLSGVDVANRGPKGAVVAALGDSITDGDQLAAMEPVDENARYTDFLAQRLLARGRASVVNVGLSGNQVTRTFIGEHLQARLDRDVLARTGATHLIVLGGINDIGLPGLLSVIGIPTAEISAQTIISGHQQLLARARAAGLVVVGATLPPSGSSPLPGYSGPAVEAKRQAVNEWVRTQAGYDAVVDFDRVLRDPSDPTVMLAELTADGLHPNSDGYRAMARAANRVLRRLR